MDLNCTPNVLPSNNAILGTSASTIAFDFIELPPEIRNMVYELLLVSGEPIPIRSPRKKHQRKTTFVSILRANKQINTEARSIFWGNNKIVIGNGDWGSTSSPNMHGLQHFIARVPKDCIRLIRYLEVEVHYYMPWIASGYHYANYGPLQMQRVLSKHFIGIDCLTIATIKDNCTDGSHNLEYSRHSFSRIPKHCPRCQIPRKALRLMATLPSLKTIVFKVEKSGRLVKLMETVMEKQAGLIKKLKFVGIKGCRVKFKN